MLSFELRKKARGGDSPPTFFGGWIWIQATIYLGRHKRL